MKSLKRVIDKSKIYFFTTLLISIISLKSFAQNQIYIEGNVTSNNEKIDNANVILKNEKTLATISYTSTNNLGFFKFLINTNEKKLRLIINCIGYESYSKDIEIVSNNINLGTIELNQNPLELNEVIIESEKKSIIIKGDTTVYNIKKFLNGTEDNLKDVLKNLPGMRINSNGKIEVNGKVISELLIDGDNLYNGQHQFATENLSSKIIKSIEFYKNHTPYDKIKTDSTTNETALNVIIKEEFKKKLKGYFLAENNLKERYKVSSTLYNLNKKNKFSLIQNWNNLGELPISIIDYFNLTKNEESENSSESSVSFSSFEIIPKFLSSGENVAKKNNSFFNLSNVLSPNKKTKINYYSIFNTSSQKEIVNNSQNFTNSNLRIQELNNNKETNLFGVFNLKSVFKPNEKTVLKMNNYYLIDKVNSFYKTASTINSIDSSINQSGKNNIQKTENNISFSKKNNSSFFFSNAFLNVERVKNSNEINSNVPFLNLNFETNYLFRQTYDKSKSVFGALSKYGFKVKKINIDLKIGYTNSNFEFENRSPTNFDYYNQYKTKEQFLTQEINSAATIYKKTTLSLTVNNNIIYQNVNFNKKYTTSFIGYSLNLKFSFTPNSILQISNSYSNSLSNQENLIQNYYIRDYRSILKNLNLQPNTLFPLYKINLNYLKSNPKTNNVLIINLNHTWTNKSENVNIINESNYSIFENSINNKNQLSDFIVYFENNLKKIPFSLTFNTDIKYTLKEYYINQNLSFFKSTYLSNSFSVRSRFKKSPIHFDFGYNFSLTDYNNNENISIYEVRQLFVNTNGIFFKNVYWRLSYSYNNFIVNNSANPLSILSAGLRYSKQKSKWEFLVNAHNVLNFDNPIFSTNLSGVGYESVSTKLNLEGYVNFGIKYKF
jgi:CarboxypepD_reg-like domain